MSVNHQTKKRLRLEIIVASPPTSKCGKGIAMMRDIIGTYPDILRLDIYYAGIQPSATPTRGYQVKNKRKRIPAFFVNGIMISAGENPQTSHLLKMVRQEIERGPQNWQD